MTATLNYIMNSILAQASFPPGTFNLMLYGVGAAVLVMENGWPIHGPAKPCPTPLAK